MSGDPAIKQLQLAFQSRQHGLVGQVAVLEQADSNGEVDPLITQINQNAICWFMRSHIRSTPRGTRKSILVGEGSGSTFDPKGLEQSEMLLDGRKHSTQVMALEAMALGNGANHRPQSRIVRM